MPSVSSFETISEDLPIENVGIIGAGWIGRQIAARLALYDIEVVLIDQNEEALSGAMQWITDLSAEYWHSIGAVPPDSLRTTWRDRITPIVWQPREQEEEIPSIIGHLDLVIECVPEQIGIKRRVLRDWSRVLAPTILLVSNSSYFPPSVLSRYVAAPQRFANLHFHAPVLRDSACDVCGGPETAPEVVSRLERFTRRIGHLPIVLRQEHPGYVFNWLLQAMLKAALELHARGVADIEQIDAAWRAVSGMSAGPFQIMDQIGLDVVEQSLANARWSNLEPVATEELLELLARQTSQGRLGVKTGKGFYDYNARSSNSTR